MDGEMNNEACAIKASDVQILWSGGARVRFEGTDQPPVFLPAGFVLAHRPKAGGYMVVRECGRIGWMTEGELELLTRTTR